MLDTAGYKANLKSAYIETITAGDDTEAALDAFLDSIVAATATFVKSAVVHYVNGLVTVDGPVTGTFNGNLQ